MRVTGRRRQESGVTRRAVLLGVCAAPLIAGPAEDVWTILARMAADLSAGNDVAFMAHVDRRAAGYERLRADIIALTRVAELYSSIDQISNQGDDRSRTLEVDWLLTIIARANSAILDRRHETVECRLAKSGRRWRVVGLQPVSFFRTVS